MEIGTSSSRAKFLRWCEQLRLLRWVLGIDTDLMPLAHFSKTDFAMSRGLFARNSSARANRQMLRSWDVRVERDIAAAYTMRIVAELKTRGVIPTSPELGSWSDQLRNESLGPSRDFVVGAKT